MYKIIEAPKKSMKSQFYPMFKGVFFGLVFAGLFSAAVFVLAVPPTSKYDFGETLNPSCTPGSTNCSVTSPATYSFSANNFSGSGSFSAGAITGTSIIDSGLTASKPVFTDANKQLTSTGTVGAGQGGTGLSSLTAYAILAGGTTSTAALQQVSGLGTSGQVLTSNGAGALPTWQAASGGVTGTGTNNYAVYWSGTSSLGSEAQLALSRGGTAASLTASNGGIVYSGASALAVLAGTATANQILMSGASTTPAWSTATYPATATGTGTILRANGTNWVASTATYPDTITANQVLYATGTNAVGSGTGLTFDGTTLNVSSTGAQEKLSYSGTIYSTFTVGSDGTLTVTNTGGATGDIILQPTGTGDVALLSDTGKMYLGGNGNTNNENLKFDFETNADVVGISSTTGVATLSLTGDTTNWTVSEPRNGTASTAGTNLTLKAGGGTSGGTNLNGGSLYLASGIATGSGSSDMFFQTATAGSSGTTDVTPTTKFTVRGNGSVVVGTGTALATTATAGFLYIPSSAGSPTGTPVADTTGTVPIQYDTTNNRLYVYRGAAWHYFAETAGFQIPNFETADPISGEQIKEGDIVLGMINQTMEDKALHGIWVKWDSVKAQLLAEARGELSQTGTWGTGSITNVNTETLLDRVTNVLTGLGIAIKDGVVNIARLAVSNFTSDKATITTARINKIEMVDAVTGEIYCTWISEGEWVKVKGSCDSSTVATALAPSQTVQQAQQVVQQAQTAAQNALETTQHAQEAVQEQTQQVVQQAQAAAQQAQTAAQQAQEAAQQVQQAAQQTQAQPQAAEPSGAQNAENEQNAGKTASEPAAAPSSESAPAQPPAPAGTTSGVNATSSAPAETPAPAETQAAPAPAEQPAPENIQNTEPSSPTETTTPSAGDLIKDAASGLLNGMLQFTEWLFGISFNQISALMPNSIKSSTAGVLKGADNVIKNVLYADYDTMSAGVDSMFSPIKKIFMK